MHLQKVSTKRIEDAIEAMRNKKHIFCYTVFNHGEEFEEKDSQWYSLPDLYRELARRIEVGTKMIRNALSEFED